MIDSLTVGQYVCCSCKSISNLALSGYPNGTCYTYKFQSGDSCFALASTHGLTVDEIDKTKNNIGVQCGYDDLQAAHIVYPHGPIQYGDIVAVATEAIVDSGPSIFPYCSGSRTTVSIDQRNHRIPYTLTDSWGDILAWIPETPSVIDGTLTACPCLGSSTTLFIANSISISTAATKTSSCGRIGCSFWTCKASYEELRCAGAMCWSGNSIAEQNFIDIYSVRMNNLSEKIC